MGLNYLQKNVAPVVDEMVVQPGARVAADARRRRMRRCRWLSLPAAGALQAVSFTPDANALR